MWWKTTYFTDFQRILKLWRGGGLKMIEVSTHSKYITEKDLLEWEEGLKGNYSVKRLNNQSVSE
jgi:hypothetical protein